MLLRDSVASAEVHLSPFFQLTQPIASHLPSPDQHDQRPTSATESATQIAHLTNQLTTAQSRISDLTTQSHNQDNLLTTYEASLQEITARLRQYAYDQQSHTISLHAHYNRLLEQSRNETVQAQLVHQAWQAGLGRLAEGVREAYQGVEESAAGPRRKIAALKSENRTLRKMVGWEEAEDDSSGDEDLADHLPGALQERGRPALGHLQ